MTTQPRDDHTVEAILARGDELDERLKHANVDEAIGALAVAGERARMYIRLLALSLGLGAFVFAGLIWALVATNRAAQEAREASSALARQADTLHATCLASNEFRATEHQLWTYVLELSASDPNNTDADAERRGQFRAYIDQALAPRDCDAEAPLVVPPFPAFDPVPSPTAVNGNPPQRPMRVTTPAPTPPLPTVGPRSPAPNPGPTPTDPPPPPDSPATPTTTPVVDCVAEVCVQGACVCVEEPMSRRRR